MKQFSRPQWIAAGVATVVVLGAGVTLAAGGGGEDKPGASTAVPGVEEASAVANALSMLAAKPENLVATDVRSAVGNKARQGVAAGATISPNKASWQPDGLGGGTMTVTVAGGGQPAATYTAIMVKEPTGWKVLGTVPMTPANAGSAPAVAGQAPAANPPGVAAPGAVAPSAGAGTTPISPVAPAGTTTQPGTVQPPAQQPAQPQPAQPPAPQGGAQ